LLLAVTASFCLASGLPAQDVIRITVANGPSYLSPTDVIVIQCPALTWDVQTDPGAGGPGVIIRRPSVSDLVMERDLGSNPEWRQWYETLAAGGGTRTNIVLCVQAPDGVVTNRLTDCMPWKYEIRAQPDGSARERLSIACTRIELP
jgi:hypothetical protein